jgi:hypothetical protein
MAIQLAHVQSPLDPVSSTVSATIWRPLVQGPYWASFEQFRTAGTTALEGIRPGMVAMLNSRSAPFRILRDEDFQRLLGLAAEVHRIKTGVRIVMMAAEVYAKHKDEESIQLLMTSLSMLSESRVLPEREGHGPFTISTEEAVQHAEVEEDIVPAAKTPRPKL